MRTTTKPLFHAVDGKIFDSELACLCHENKLLHDKLESIQNEHILAFNDFGATVMWTIKQINNVSIQHPEIIDNWDKYSNKLKEKSQVMIDMFAKPLFEEN